MSSYSTHRPSTVHSSSTSISTHHAGPGPPILALPLPGPTPGPSPALPPSARHAVHPLNQIPPPPPPPLPPPPPPQSTSVSAAHQRLSDALTLIKHEFDAILIERDTLRGQAEELDSHLALQINELAAIRRSVLDLESQHLKVRGKYEEEIRRLRNEIDEARTAAHGHSLSLSQTRGAAPATVTATATATTSSSLPIHVPHHPPPPNPVPTQNYPPPATPTPTPTLINTPNQNSNSLNWIPPSRRPRGAGRIPTPPSFPLSTHSLHPHSASASLHDPERELARPQTSSWETSTMVLVQPLTQSKLATKEGRVRDRERDRERERDSREAKRLKTERSSGDRDRDRERNRDRVRDLDEYYQGDPQSQGVYNNSRDHREHSFPSSSTSTKPLIPLYTAQPHHGAGPSYGAGAVIPASTPSHPPRERERERDYALPPLGSGTSPSSLGSYPYTQQHGYIPVSVDPLGSAAASGTGGAYHTFSATASPSDVGNGNMDGTASRGGSSSSKATGQGGDWQVIHNNRVKSALDIGLLQSFAHSSVVCCVQFSQDGKFLATGCNRTAQIYDVLTGAVVCVLEDKTGSATDNHGDGNNGSSKKDGGGIESDLYIRSVRFSPDGKLLATGAEDKRIRVWDIARRRIRYVLNGHTQEIYSLDWSEDGRLIVSGSGDCTARVWDMLDYEYNRSGSGYGVSAEEDASNSISAGSSPRSGRVSMSKILSVPIFSALQPVSSGSGAVGTTGGGAKAGGRSNAGSSTSSSSTPSPTSAIGESVSGNFSGTLDSKSSSSGTAVSDDLATITSTTANDPGGVVVSRSSGTLTSDSGITSVAISQDRRFVAAGSLDWSVWIWDVETGQLVERLRGHKDSVYSVAFTKSGRGLVSGSLDMTMKGWDIAAVVTGATTGMRKGKGRSQDGSSAVEKETAAVSLSKIGTGMCPCTMDFLGHKDYVLSVALSSDTQWIVSGSKDRHVQFWDATGTSHLMLRGHKNSVISLDLNSKHGLLATGSGDNLARVWRYSSNQT